MQKFLRALWSDEAGQDATEYILIIVFLCLIVAAGMAIFGGQLNNAFSTVGGTLEGSAESAAGTLPGGGGGNGGNGE